MAKCSKELFKLVCCSSVCKKVFYVKYSDGCGEIFMKYIKVNKMQINSLWELTLQFFVINVSSVFQNKR